MNRSHFIKMLGVGAATPLLLKAGISLGAKPYTPLGLISMGYTPTPNDNIPRMISAQWRARTIPDGTRGGDWIVYDSRTGWTIAPDGAILAADDISGTYLTYDWTRKYPFGYVIDVWYNPHLRFHYSPSSVVDPRYKDYLIPDWKPYAPPPGCKHIRVEDLVKILNTV